MAARPDVGKMAEEVARVLKFQAREPLEDPVKFESLASLVLPLYLPAVIMHMTRALVITVLPLHVLSLGMSYEDVGMLTTIGGFGMMLGNIPTGAFITAHGPRAAMLLACGLFVAVAAIASLAQPGSLTLAPLAAAFLLLGLAENTGILARQTFMGATVPKGMRGRAGSTLGGTQRLGYTIAPCVGGLVANAAGHRAAYALQATLAVLGALAILRFVPPISATQDISKKASDRLGEAQEAPPPSLATVARRHWRCLMLISVFSGCLTCVRKTRELLFSLEGHARDLSQAEVGAIAASSYCVDAMLFPVAGMLLDGKGRTSTGALSLGGSSVALLILLSRSAASMVVFGIVSGAANGLSAGVILSIGADMAPANSRGHFLALFRTFSRTADVLAPSAIGILARYASLTAAELFAAAVGLAGAAWAHCLVQETLRDEPDAAATTDSERTADSPGHQESSSEEDLEMAPLKAKTDLIDPFS